MTEEEIIEGNKLIAEFMGHSTDEDFIDLFGYDIYDKIWDKLMPVVEKIESEGLFTRIVNLSNKSEEENIEQIHACEISDWLDNEISYCKSTSKIEAVWLSVVGFIKKYNTVSLHH